MGNQSGQTFEIPKQSSFVAELFTMQEQRDDDKREKIFEIPLAEIDDFPAHPFRVHDDEAMQSMVESVKKSGVLTPAIARKKEDGRFELVSGHRRKHAAALAGLAVLPVIVREMTRDEAVIFMVESNFQREQILPSEKAFAYKMRLDAMRRQAGRPGKENSVPMGQNFDGKTSRELLAEKTGDSNTQIQRFIRLTSLTPELLQMVDDGKIGFRPAVELSYLAEAEQAALLEAVGAQEATPSLAQALKMKQFSQANKLSPEVVQSILCEEKPNQREKISFSVEKVKNFFKPGTPVEAMEKTILKALDFYQRHRKPERNEPDL